MNLPKVIQALQIEFARMLPSKSGGVLAAAFFAFAAPLGASVQLAFDQTVGSRHYRGTDASVDVGFGERKEGKGEYHLRPAVQMYKSDASSDTFKTFSLRFGYEQALWDVGLTAGGAPEVDDYGTRFFGADVNWHFAGGDLGAGFLHTRHQDELLRSASRTIGRRASAVDIGQTDLSVSAGAPALWSYIGAEISRSFYSRDLAAISARAAQIQQLAGLDAIVQGFPKSNFTLFVELRAIPMMTPFASFTRTTFQLDTPSSAAFTLGASAKLGPGGLSVSVQRLDPGGGAEPLHYVTLGAGVGF